MNELKKAKTVAECIEEVKIFIDKFCNGNVEELKHFDFQNLSYGECSKGGFDCDDTLLARDIYFILMHEKIEGLTFEEIGTGKKYRGDCINTLGSAISRNTVENLLKKQNYDEDIIISYKNNPSITIGKKSDLAEKIYKMIKLYHTYGNFICLPNKKGTIRIDRRIWEKDKQKYYNETFNQYRGSYCFAEETNWNKNEFSGGLYADYFHVFLRELESCFNKEEYADKYLLDIFKQNSDYFDNIKDNNEKPGFSKFYDLNYLDKKYIYEYEKKLQIVRWGDFTSGITEEEYKKYLEVYLDYAIMFIENRAKQMEIDLKNIFKLNQ